jgi:hypothetical protein
MSTTYNPNAPVDVPDRVAIETLHGDIRAGEVIKTEYVATAADGIERMFYVDVDGSTFKRLASEVGAP